MIMVYDLSTLLRWPVVECIAARAVPAKREFSRQSWLTTAVVLALVSLLAGLPGASAADVTIEEMELTAPRPDTSLKAPLVAENDNSWTAQVPLWTGRSRDLAAHFWMATTTKAFLFRVVVDTPRQENPYH